VPVGRTNRARRLNTRRAAGLGGATLNYRQLNY